MSIAGLSVDMNGVDSKELFLCTEKQRDWQIQEKYMRSSINTNIANELSKRLDEYTIRNYRDFICMNVSLYTKHLYRKC